MNKSGIGVQQIVSRVGADWRGGRRTPGRQNDKEDNKDEPTLESAQSPPPVGLGKILDKTV
jgi:hypothetical protein